MVDVVEDGRAVTAGRPTPRVRRGGSDVRAGVALSAVGFTIAALGAVLVLLARDLEVSPQDLSWLSSAFGAGLVIVAPVGARLLALGGDTVLRAGSLVLALGAATLAVASVTPVVVLGALALGAGGAAVVLAVSALLAGADAPRRLAAVNAASSAAGIAAPLLIGGLDAVSGAGRLALLVMVPPLLVIAAVRGRVTSPAEAPSAAPSAPSAAPAETTEVAPARTAHPLVGPPGAGRRWVTVVAAVSVEFCFVVWAVARLQLTGLPAAAAVATATVFPLGMALGRASGIVLAGWPRVLPVSAAVTLAGTALVVASPGPVLVAAGLFLAGLGAALLYPVTLAELLAVPGLGTRRGASAGALASGTAILLAPVALAGLSGLVDLRLAFLLVLPLLAVAVWRPTPREGRRRTAAAAGDR